jgi:hypothetical protein
MQEEPGETTRGPTTATGKGKLRDAKGGEGGGTYFEPSSSFARYPMTQCLGRSPRLD